MDKIQQYKRLASWFGAGYISKMPGTVGSAAALPFAYILYLIGGGFALAVAGIAITAYGVAICDKILAVEGDDKDPSWIVIDEVAGMWLSLCLVPFSPVIWLTGFVIFRFFDMVKPWPVSIPDKQMPNKRITDGQGIMLDDVIAGIITAVLLVLIF